MKGTKASLKMLSLHYSTVSGSNGGIIASLFHLIMSLVIFQFFEIFPEIFLFWSFHRPGEFQDAAADEEIHYLK